jgi:RNA 3'-terminal phosphate cyclase (ATP)
MIEIDGSQGEGGGQIVRSALTLAMATGQAVHISQVRARRPKPGLQAQHLTAVRAATEMCGAEVDGARLGSSELIFVPGVVRPGNYRLDIGTAGSTSLVLQTVTLPLSLTDADSEVTLTGGTHVPWSPSTHYLERQWVPILRRMGLAMEVHLRLAGFYPQGGGEVYVRIEPAQQVAPLHLPERGALKRISGISAVANLDISIAERQRSQALRQLRGRARQIEIEILEQPSRGKGTFLLVQAEFKHSSACYVALGAPGKRAEQVADEACLSLERFLAGTGAVDEHLADQILVPLAFASGPSEYHTVRVTPHLLTNAAVVKAFDAAAVDVSGTAGETGSVRIQPRNAPQKGVV